MRTYNKGGDRRWNAIVGRHHNRDDEIQACRDQETKVVDYKREKIREDLKRPVSSCYQI
jgi:hypothetical protein